MILPIAVLMVGMPGSGKSTYASQMFPNFQRISSDDFIEQVAHEQNKTYNEIFKGTINQAQNYCWAQFQRAIELNKAIVIDRTNLSTKSRKKYLLEIPSYYYKIIVEVECRDEVEWNRRLNSRPGKTIPNEVLKMMTNSYQSIMPNEGHNYYIYHDSSTEGIV